MKCSVAVCVVAMLAASCSALPVADSPPPPPKSGLSIWSAAKRFFSFRDHLREKVNASKAGIAPFLHNATRAAMMPTAYAISYKKMTMWWCAKPQNKPAKLCSPQGAVGPASASKVLGVPTTLESKDMHKAYCAEKANKSAPVCLMSSLKYGMGGIGGLGRFGAGPIGKTAHPTEDGSLQQRKKAVFGAADERPPLSEHALELLQLFITQWRNGKSKMSNLISRLDKDGDGELQRNELRSVFRELAADAEVRDDGEEEQEQIELFDGAPQTRPEGMDPHTWVRFVLGEEMRRRQWRGIDLYRTMDKDKGGFVDKGEFCRALMSLGLPLLGQEEAEALWEDFDADGGGAVDANELKSQFDKLKSQVWSANGKPIRMRTPPSSAEISQNDAAIDEVLNAFDSDGSGSIDAHELKRALCGQQVTLDRRILKTGGAGEHDVTANNARQLRQNVDLLSNTGRRLVALDPDAEKLQEALRQVLCLHSSDILSLYQFQGDLIVSQRVFVGTAANVFGLNPSDVGRAPSAALRGAVASLFASWDLLGEGMSLTELNKILHKGGRISVARRAKADAIFLHEVRAKPVDTAKKKDRRDLLSEAKSKLHGFVIKSRDEQLKSRADRVAPVKLEALMAELGKDPEQVLELFLKWDADGDGTVCSSEFSAAVSKLGFKFSREVTDELFSFFDKDGSDSVTLDEIQTTLRWGKERKHMRPLLAGWRQLSLSLGDHVMPLHEQMRLKMSEQGKHPKEVFKFWDEDGTGTLDRDELNTLMYELGGMELSLAEADKLFSSFDHDESGKITFKELNSMLKKEVPVEQLMNALSQPESQGKLSELFASKWDTDGDGLLDLQEFKGVLVELKVNVSDDAALRDLFVMLDEDGSGSISLKELQNSLRWVRSCEKCEELRNEAYTFDGTISIQTQIRRALAINAVRVMDLFREWDVSGDGLLSPEEFHRAMPLLGIHASTTEIEELYNAIDYDGDRVITFKEFNRVLRKENESMGVDDLRDPFGNDIHSNWRPRSPPVTVCDLDKLRQNVKTEHKMRGLEKVNLKPPSKDKVPDPATIVPGKGADVFPQPSKLRGSRK